MLKGYLIVSYAVLVKAGRWHLEPPTEPDGKPVVPEEYRVPVAIYLATGEIAA